MEGATQVASELSLLGAVQAQQREDNVARMRECIKYQDELIHVIIIVRKSDDCRIAAIEGRLKMLDPQ